MRTSQCWISSSTEIDAGVPHFLWWKVCEWLDGLNPGELTEQPERIFHSDGKMLWIRFRLDGDFQFKLSMTPRTWVIFDELQFDPLHVERKS